MQSPCPHDAWVEAEGVDSPIAVVGIDLQFGYSHLPAGLVGGVGLHALHAHREAAPLSPSKSWIHGLLGGFASRYR